MPHNIFLTGICSGLHPDTILLSLLYHVHTKLIDNIIQGHTAKWIIGFLAVYKQLVYYFIVFPFYLKYLRNVEYKNTSWFVASKSTLTLLDTILNAVHKFEVPL